MKKIIPIILFLCSTSVFAANAPLEKTITLKQLTAQDSLNLSGPGAAKYIYLPIPNHWQTNSIKLHLLITNSNLPNHATSLTAFINDKPINSFNTQQMKSEPGSWDFVIPAGAIKPKTTTILIKSGWENKDATTCKNFSDPSFWTTINGDSTITYQYTENNTETNLALFPMPFINKSAIEKDALTIALPDQFNHDDLETLFYTAQAFTRLQTWRGITLTGVNASTLSDAQKNTNNLVIIGRGATNSLLQSSLIQWPLAQNAKHEWVNKNQEVIPADTGIIMLAVSPWNSHHIILAITGNSDAGAAKAALALRSPNFKHALLSPNYALITSVNSNSISPINWGNTTFDKLGFKTQTVYGDGENTLNYSIQLPPEKIAKQIDIQLAYTTSPLLAKTANSFLSLMVNQSPISGIRLEPDQPDMEFWNVRINGDDLLPGQNVLTFTFNLKFHNNTCAQDDQSLAYATVNAEKSTLSVKFSAQNALLNFSSFNTSPDNVVLLLPKKNAYFTQTNFIAVVIELAKALVNTPSFVTDYNDSTISSQYADRNIIYIGKLADNSELTNLRHQFPFSFKNNLLEIKPALLPLLSLSGDTPDALLEIIPSPFDKNRALLLISANKLDDYQSALATLTNPEKNKYLKGDTALIYPNGTFTSVKAQQLLIKAENKHRLLEANILTSNGLISFVSIFFGGIIVLIIYRRIRRYFSKNK